MLATMYSDIAKTSPIIEPIVLGSEITVFFAILLIPIIKILYAFCSTRFYYPEIKCRIITASILVRIINNGLISLSNAFVIGNTIPWFTVSRHASRHIFP